MRTEIGRPSSSMRFNWGVDFSLLWNGRRKPWVVGPPAQAQWHAAPTVTMKGWWDQ
jgi:hypothetical protein